MTAPRDDRTIVTPSEDADDRTVVQGTPLSESDRTIVTREEDEESRTIISAEGADRPAIDAERTMAMAGLPIDQDQTDRTVIGQDSFESQAAPDATFVMDPDAPGEQADQQTLVSQTTFSVGPHGQLSQNKEATDSTRFVVHERPPGRGDETVALKTTNSTGQPVQASATIPDAASRRSPTSRSLTIGRFEVRRILGQGAFGTVYLAHDARLDRPVAIKVAKTGVLSGKADVDRFQREARSAAQLRHPHIVPVYEFGESHESSYIAYEFIKGRTLKTFIEERGKLTVDEAVTLTRKLAAALHYAHVRGIVHRDMKPENILLDEEGEPHIADFGLARRDEGDVTRTREGLFMGTPAYMSPEQALGKAHLADGRADVWSLGVMLREMLTGKRPFEGKLTEVLRAVTEKEPVPIRQLDPSLPADLETICQKCLTKAPEGRYQTGEELADELERWQRGEPILARPISVLARTGRWMKRNPQVAGLIGTVCATLFLGFVVSGYFAVAAHRASKRAQAEEAKRAIAELDGVLLSVPDAVPVHLNDLRRNAESVRSRLDELLADPQLSSQEALRSRLALASLFPSDERVPKSLDDLGKELLTVEPAELNAAVTVLEPFAATLTESFWPVARSAQTDQASRLRAAAALARLAPDDPGWPAIGSDVVVALSGADTWELADWVEAFGPVREVLRPELEKIFQQGETPSQRRTSGVVLARLFADDINLLLPLLPIAAPEQLPEFVSVLDDRKSEAIPALEKRLNELVESASQSSSPDGVQPAVNYAAVLVSLGRGETVWNLLGERPDKSFRTAFIDAAAQAGVPWETLSQRLTGESDARISAALILALGNYGVTVLPPSKRRTLLPVLLSRFHETTDAGVHAAADWTLRQFGFDDDVQAARLALKATGTQGSRHWFTNKAGVTFATVDGPVEFVMGCRPNDANDPVADQNVERPHRRQIPRSFAVSMREVTVDEFLRFRPDHVYEAAKSPDPHCPINSVSWYDAAKYCRWLSEQEGIPEEEMVYPPVDQIDSEMKVDLTRLSRTGYRLPTAAEWEYVCRAHATTARPWSSGADFMERYAWFERNSQERSWPVGRLKPNDFGLFDIHGNMLEWCYDSYFETYPEENSEGLVIDGIETRESTTQELRGGCFDNGIELLRTPDRDSDDPIVASPQFGFRLARTVRE